MPSKNTLKRTIFLNGHMISHLKYFWSALIEKRNSVLQKQTIVKWAGLVSQWKSFLNFFLTFLLVYDTHFLTVLSVIVKSNLLQPE